MIYMLHFYYAQVSIAGQPGGVEAARVKIRVSWNSASLSKGYFTQKFSFTQDLVVYSFDLKWSTTVVGQIFWLFVVNFSSMCSLAWFWASKRHHIRGSVVYMALSISGIACNTLLHLFGIWCSHSFACGENEKYMHFHPNLVCLFHLMQNSIRMN